MSTGDQSAFIRSRLETRGSAPRAKFMESGFNRWAESERPARMGGMDKEPAEATAPMTGGISLAEIPGKMKQFYDEAKKYSPVVKKILRSKNLERLGPKSAETAKKIADYMEMVGLGYCKDVGVELHGRGFSGTVEEFAKVAKKVYDFMKENEMTIHAVLNIPKVVEQTNGYSKKVSEVLKMVGLGYMKDGEEYSTESESMDGSGFIEGGAYGHAKADVALRGSADQDPLDRRFKMPKGLKNEVKGGLELERIYREVIMRLNSGESEAVIKHDLMVELGSKGALETLKEAKRRRGGAIKLSPQVLKNLDPLGVGKKIRKSIKKSGKGVMEMLHEADAVDSAETRKVGSGKAEMAETMARFKETEKMLKDNSQRNFAYENVFGRKVGSAKGDATYMSGGMSKLIQRRPTYDEMGLGPSSAPKGMLRDLPMGSGKGKKAPSARNLIVKKVMREKGLSLPQASKYVKKHGLY